MNLQLFLRDYGARTEARLSELISEQDSLQPSLQQAMRYGLLNGGKRIRPALVYLACHFCGGDDELADLPAAAMEMVHSYSLIHDDLPAMDNDTLRRGKPTCHIAFDEATAILAGDALLTLAFELLSRPHPRYSATQQLALVQRLARASGDRGMVLGQAFDLAHVGQTLTLEQLEQMHAHKTGALITAALELGAIASGQASAQQHEDLRRFGDLIGLAFQVKDDLLDVEGDTQALGKQAGSDQLLNKPTYPALLGLEGAHAKLAELHRDACTVLGRYGDHAAPLRALADYIVTRQH